MWKVLVERTGFITSYELFITILCINTDGMIQESFGGASALCSIVVKYHLTYNV